VSRQIPFGAGRFYDRGELGRPWSLFV